MNLKKILIIAGISLAIILVNDLVLIKGFSPSGGGYGGTVHNFQEWFSGGLIGGSGGSFIVTSTGSYIAGGTNGTLTNGLETQVKSGSFAVGTTTIVSLANPWSPTATSIVNFIGLTQTGVATSTFKLSCGTSYSKSAPQVGSTPTNVFINTSPQASSTSFFTIYQTATSSPVYIGPTQFFYCVAQGKNGEDPLGNSGGYDSAFTNTNSAFGGTYKVEFRR